MEREIGKEGKEENIPGINLWSPPWADETLLDPVACPEFCYGRSSSRVAEARRAESGMVFLGGAASPPPPARRSGERCKLPSGVRAEPRPPSGFAYV